MHHHSLSQLTNKTSSFWKVDCTLSFTVMINKQGIIIFGGGLISSHAHVFQPHNAHGSDGTKNNNNKNNCYKVLFTAVYKLTHII